VGRVYDTLPGQRRSGAAADHYGRSVGCPPILGRPIHQHRLYAQLPEQPGMTRQCRKESL
jgi:hypothetical protein